jgi:hypothetical protein
MSYIKQTLRNRLGEVQWHIDNENQHLQNATQTLLSIQDRIASFKAEEEELLKALQE